MTLGLVGVGLIGGSIGLAARARADAEVRGYDPSARALECALERGAVDRPCDSLAEAVDGAELVVVAAPVGVLPELVGEVLAVAGADCVVTDVGSTKRAIVAAHGSDQRFVGGHPLAGAETSGVEHARPDLFDGATWYLTPAEHSSGMLYERLHRLIVALGARPAAIEPEAHDRLMATVSHLPHVLANVLVGQAARGLEAEGERLPATGPSFRDATRVAGASSAIWTDIYVSNREALARQIDETVRRLQAVRASLAAADAPALAAWNDSAREDRERLLEVELAGGPVHELRVAVPNRPGVVAEIALALGRAGVNIVDMALYPAPDASEGSVALWLAGEQQADRAAALIGELGLPVVRL